MCPRGKGVDVGMCQHHIVTIAILQYNQKMSNRFKWYIKLDKIFYRPV